MTKKEYIIKIAEYVKEYVEKNKKLPSTIPVLKTYYTIPQATYLLSKFITKPGDVNLVKVGGAKNPNGDRCNRQVSNTNYMDMAKRVSNFIEENGYSPNYVVIKDNQKCIIQLWIYVASKIVTYYSFYTKLPNSILINSQDFVKSFISDDEVYIEFVKNFGVINTIDDALEKVKGKGYGYYYDDRYSNKETIKRMKNGLGVNCTDATQTYYHIGKAQGYDVRVVHVKCKGGDGHVRLQFRKNNGWFDRDPAAILNGSNITDIWCSNGTILSYNPGWWFANVNR